MAVYLRQIVEVSQVVTNLAVALGAMVGIYFGAGELRARIKASRLKKRFPLSRLGKDFRLAESISMPGRIYIIETKPKKRYWIQNMATAIDLGFLGYQVDKISHKDLQKYQDMDSPKVLTRGEPGT